MALASYLVGNVSTAVGYTVNPLVDTTITATAAVTLTLPKATACYPGQQFRIANNVPGATGGVVTVAPNGTDTINGVNASDTSLALRFMQYELATDGVSAWIQYPQAAFVLQIPDGEIYNAYADRRFTLGQAAQTRDGRRFRFALNGGVTLVPGDVLQASIPITNHILQTPSAQAALAATTVSVTIGATAVTADQYRDGVLSIELGTGFGFVYPIGTHIANAGGGAFSPAFKSGVTVQAVVPTTANSVTFVASPYSGVIQFPATTATGVAVGVAVVALTTGQFGWIQTGGFAAVTQTGSAATGTNAAVPSGTAGSVLAVALATTGVIGVVHHLATATNKSTVFLTLP